MASAKVEALETVVMSQTVLALSDEEAQAVLELCGTVSDANKDPLAVAAYRVVVALRGAGHRYLRPDPLKVEDGVISFSGGNSFHEPPD